MISFNSFLRARFIKGSSVLLTKYFYFCARLALRALYHNQVGDLVAIKVTVVSRAPKGAQIEKSEARFFDFLVEGRQTLNESKLIFL